MHGRRPAPEPLPPFDPRRADFQIHGRHLPNRRPRATRENLARIRVLFRDADTLSLWGLPYEMRLGQAPRDVHRNHRGEWIWLGQPGWFGSMTPEERRAVEEFLAAHDDKIPRGAYEWCTLRTGGA